MDSKNTGDKTYPQGYEPQETLDSADSNVRNQLLDLILHSGPSKPSKPSKPSEPSEIIDTDLFAVMAKRR